MNELERLSERGDERGAGTVFERATYGPATSDRSSRALVFVGAAVVIVVAVLAALVLRDVDEPEQDLVADVPPPEAVFYAETDTTLLFDDGSSGITALDLDTGAVERRDVGNQAGDQPFRLHRTANRLVVGWRNITSVPMQGAPVALGTDAVFVPAIEPGSVWVYDVAEPRTVSRVSVVDGGVLEGPLDVPTGATPVRGVAGGLAYETGDGIVVRDRDGVGADLGAVLGDVHGELVAYCDALDACTRGVIVDLGNGDQVSFSTPDGGQPMDIRRSRFSPDGRTLAVAAGPELLLIDVATAVRTVVEADGFAAASHLGWTDDGSQLFWSSDSHGALETTVGRYEVATGRSSHRDLEIGGLLSFVAVPSESATTPDLHAFARGETEPPPLAPQVDLLLGREVIATRPAMELGSPAGWVLDVESWGAFTGPFSALRLLATSDGIIATTDPPGGTTTTTTARRGCRDLAQSSPDGIEYDEHVVYEPAGSVSCLDSFAVEVFSRRGEIVAVSLVLYEP
jgi:hypothetical protein